MRKTSTSSKSRTTKKAGAAKRAPTQKKLTDAGALKLLKADKRIDIIDDERSMGNSLIVNLKDGWRFNDEGEHIFGEDSAVEALESMKRVTACGCGDCLKALGRFEAVGA